MIKLTGFMLGRGKSKIPQFIIGDGKKEKTQVWIDDCGIVESAIETKDVDNQKEQDLRDKPETEPTVKRQDYHHQQITENELKQINARKIIANISSEAGDCDIVEDTNYECGGFECFEYNFISAVKGKIEEYRHIRNEAKKLRGYEFVEDEIYDKLQDLNRMLNLRIKP